MYDITDAKLMLDLMSEFAAMGIALQTDIVNYINGTIDVTELPNYTILYAEDILKKMNRFAVDDSVDDLLTDVRWKKRTLNSPLFRKEYT